MTDSVFAQDMIREAFPVTGGRNIKSAIGEAFTALRRRERALPRHVISERPRQWTERRVKALWHREARRVDHYEIQDLTAIAVEEAKRELERSKARQARLSALLSDPMAYRGGELADRVRERVGGMDRAGTGGADFDAADEDQSTGWGR